MAEWHELVKAGKFAEAEPLLIAETDQMDQYGENTVTRAEFYEDWGDNLSPADQAVEKYHEALRGWQIYASWSTSGGEGTARMMDVNRVLAKIEHLKGQ